MSADYLDFRFLIFNFGIAELSNLEPGAAQVPAIQNLKSKI